MLKVKKILSMVLVIVMATSVGASAFASESSEDVYQVNGIQVSAEQLDNLSEGVLSITPSSERINSNGSFTFNFGSALISSRFKVNSTSTTISINASIQNPVGSDVTSSYPNHQYQIILYKDGVFDTKVDQDFFYADGCTYTFTAIGLDTNATYYFKIINNDYLPAGTTLVGYGSVSSYVHI